ncbi:MAG TPA: STM3941 family protein [Bacteroidia bacterium]|nr:STM3941 family protein [Bacteroidia bacterium]
MLTQQNTIEIKPRKKVMILILLPSLYFTFNFCNNIHSEITGNTSFSIGILFNVAISLALAVVSGYVAGYSIKRMSDTGPGLVLNKEGFTDNSGLVSAGHISWSDVEEINSNKVGFVRCVIVKVKNPEKYIANQKSPFKRTWLKLENRYYGSPVNISVGGLKIKFKDLFRVVQQHYLSSHVESRTSRLKHEKDVIQQEKTELVNSINYAKRIQAALLPSNATIEQHLGECFILFLPKDIVSGDFYWVNTWNEWVFFAGCDCTGHGVPGALISIVCNNALNRTLKEYGIIQPSRILDKVAELITESIGSDAEVKDGMDASVCAFNKNTRELFWAGANIPLWIAREDTFYELLEFKPDKQPIGPVENRVPYTNHKIEIKKGDILYLFSDGYADQFGGEQGKKLTRKKFKELLMRQRGISLHDQHNNLLNFHKEYKGYIDQVDDILVMGVRVEH